MTDPSPTSTPKTAARFETRRLILRRPAPADEAALVALDQEADVLEYLTMRGADPNAIAGRIKARIASSQADPEADYGWWVLEDRETGALLGRGLLAPLWEGADDVEIGLYLRGGSRRKGYATEAAGALLDHAFKGLALPRVVAVTVRKDMAVRRLLGRLGLTHKGKVILYGVEADRYVITSGGWLPRRS